MGSRGQLTAVTTIIKASGYGFHMKAGKQDSLCCIELYEAGLPLVGSSLLMFVCLMSVFLVPIIYLMCNIVLGWFLLYLYIAAVFRVLVNVIILHSTARPV